MNKVTNEQKNKVSTLDNLKKLANVFFSKQELNALTEIEKARNAINTVCRNVKSKLNSINEPVDMAIPEVKPHATLPPKKPDTRDPSKLAASSYGKENFQRPYAQKNGNAKGFDGKQNSNGFKQRQDFSQRPSQNRFNGQKPFGKYNGQNGQFGQKPLKRLGTAEVDIDVDMFKNADRTFGNKKKTHNQPQEKKQLSKKAQMRWNIEEYENENDENETRMGRRYKVKKKEEPAKPIEATKIESATITTDNLTVKLLSEKIGVPVAKIVKKLFILGIMATINSTIDFDTAELVSNEFGIKLEKKVVATAEEQLKTRLSNALEEDQKNLQPRPPVVTVMGHVDHGKTSLLDAIRKTNVVSGEAGGITQSIGAYTTKVNGRTITFIDTPGHAAFTAMRARGAQLTDIAVLVVAADDGIMPQTIEAINHIKAAGVPMIVAINKIDKPEANIDRVMKGLADQNVLPEEWGGDTICVPIAAKLGKNIDKLLEMILLVADVQDLKANPNRPAVGTIIESRLDKGKGPVASVLVQNGTLKVGDTVISGIAFGKVRAMMDENGKPVKKATPSTPVQILGLDAVPESGDSLTVVDEKMKNQIIAERKNKIKQDKINSQGAVNIDDLFNKADENSLKVLNIIIKADVQGSVEALKASLADLRNDEAKVVCVHSAVGNITESDVLLAQASNAIIIGFNVKCEGKASAMAEKNKIQIKSYSIIYECIDDVKLALKGMLAPKYEDKQVGTLEVRQIFKISSVGTIAGCYVLEGKITKNSKVHVIRNGKEIAQADVESLKVQKNEAKEVTKGFECGIKLKGFDDIKEFDQFVAFVSERVEI